MAFMPRPPANVLQFRKVPPRKRRAARRKGKSNWRFAAMLVALPLGAFLAVFAWDGPPSANSLGFAAPGPSASDRESAQFTVCSGAVRVNCVVDGDTFWYAGRKIRIADINTPEVSEPACASEAKLGRRATYRLLALLNEGPFSLEPGGDGRDRDKYGRLLRNVERGGSSLGHVLVSEGLAERWKGYRGEWC